MTYRLFPLNDDGLPGISDWPNKARTDAAEVWPGDPLAIETTGLLVVDLDVNHANGHDGLASWEALGFVTSPASVETKSGGRHLFYRLPEDVDPESVRSSASVLGPGVDIKSWHSFVRAYGTTPPLQSVPVAPLGLVKACQRVDVASTVLGRVEGHTAPLLHPWVRAAVDGITTDLANAVPGTFNDVQTSKARRLVLLANNPAAGLTLSEAFGTFKDACLAAGAWDEKSEYRWTSAVHKYAAEMAYVPEEPATAETASDIDPEIAAAVRKLTVAETARRIHAGQNYTGLNVLDWDDVLDERTSGWLVENLISTGTNFLVAKGSTGKTFLALDMVCSIVTGRNWRGRDVQAANVVYVVGEGKGAFGRRVRAWCEANGVHIGEVLAGLTLVTDVNLNNDECLRRLRAVVDEKNAGLVVFDTWARTAGVQDEDDNATASLTLSGVDAALGDVAKLYLHHPNKNTEDTAKPVARGASAVFGAADMVLTLFRDKHHPENGANRMHLALSSEDSHGGKNRDGLNETLTGFYIDTVTVPGMDKAAAAMFWNDADSGVKKEYRAILDAFAKADTPNLDKAALSTLTGYGTKSIERYLPAMCEDGLLNRERKGGVNSPFMYSKA